MDQKAILFIKITLTKIANNGLLLSVYQTHNNIYILHRYKTIGALVQLHFL